MKQYKKSFLLLFTYLCFFHVSAVYANDSDDQASDCVIIKTIHIDHVTLLPDEVITAIRGDYLGRCLAMTDIQQLIDALTNAYLERGYITSRVGIVLPQDELQNGQLTLVAQEGNVGGVEWRGTDKPSPLFADMIGQPLNMRTIETRLEWLNRLNSYTATTAIAPGDAEGESIITVDMKRKQSPGFTMTFDNSGSETTGENRLTWRANFDNPFHIADNLSMHFTGNYEEAKDRHLSEEWGVSYDFPYRQWLFGGSVGKSRYLTHSVLPSTYILYTFGNTLSQNIFAEHFVHRSEQHKAKLKYTLSTKEEESFTRILDFTTKSAVGSRKLTVLDVSYQHTIVSPTGTLFVQPSIRKGVPILGGLDDDDNLLPQRAQFASAKFYGAWSQQFSPHFSWQSTLNMQLSEDVLFGSEQFSLGGQGSVRGFKRYSLAGKSGYSWQNALNIALPYGFRLTPFIDAGEVWAEGRLQHMSGAGITAAYQRRHLSVEATYGKSLYTPDGLPQENGALYFRVNLMF